MLLTTTEKIPGKEYEVLGLVEGSMIQSKNIGKDITQGFKGIVGGELRQYTTMLNESREAAKERMIAQATALGADAVVAVRYTTSAVIQGAAEMLAYGTAVKFI